MYKTYQEAFDQTIDKLVTQGNFGYDYEDELCMYRTFENNRCAVGINLKDETLDRMGTKQSCGLETVWDIVADDIRITDDSNRDYTFWCHMQTIHDSYALRFGKPAESLMRLQEKYEINTGKEILLAGLSNNRK